MCDSVVKPAARLHRSRSTGGFSRREMYNASPWVSRARPGIQKTGVSKLADDECSLPEACHARLGGFSNGFRCGFVFWKSEADMMLGLLNMLCGGHQAPEVDTSSARNIPHVVLQQLALRSSTCSYIHLNQLWQAHLNVKKKKKTLVDYESRDSLDSVRRFPVIRVDLRVAAGFWMLPA